MKRIWFFTLALLVTFSVAEAQSIKLQLANREYDNMRYTDAIPLYEALLKKEKNKDNTEVKVKLADCYRKVKDTDKALRMYANLATMENPSPKFIWYYAQALAEKGYYQEASEWYEKYAQAVPDAADARMMSEAYSDVSAFYKDSADYKLQFIHSINSWQSDFSPAFYKNGLLFLSNRDQQEIVRRVFEQDQSAFLNFYFASDTATITTELKTEPQVYTVSKHGDRHDDYTYFTSNDTHIPGHYGNTYLFDSVRYHYDNETTVTHVKGALHSKYHEGPVSFTKNQDTIFITRSSAYAKHNKEKSMSRFEIFMSVIEKGKWTDPQEVSFNGEGFSTGHPALTPDNKKMYFSSDRPGGLGGSDIYVVEYINGTFTTPVNVTEINTPGNEMFPYVDAKGTLYFSSDGHPGLGGLDLFRVIKDRVEIIDVENMGYPFNSSQDDFGIIWKNDMTGGFISSNRKRGHRDDDIYSFTRLCRSVTAHVYDSVTQAPLDSVLVTVGDWTGITDHEGNVQFCLRPGKHNYMASKRDFEKSNGLSSRSTLVKIPLNPLRFDLAGRIVSKEDNSPIEGAKIVVLNEADSAITEFVTGKDGNYYMPLALRSDYKITVSKKSCGTQSKVKSTNGLTTSQTLRGDMDMLCQGDIIRIDNIYYDLNKYNIRADAATELDKLALLFNEYPDMRVELRSHTDSRSSATFNMSLSTNRAQAVLDYLGTHGVVPSRMRASGYGETLPVNGCKDGVKCSEQEYQQNRRTEFRVLSIR